MGRGVAPASAGAYRAVGVKADMEDCGTANAVHEEDAQASGERGNVGEGTGGIGIDGTALKVHAGQFTVC
jgi:hypothetical protein